MGALMSAVMVSLRSLSRSPAFTVPVLIILVIGMTAVTAVFTVADSIVFRPLGFPDSERLVVLSLGRGPTWWPTKTVGPESQGAWQAPAFSAHSEPSQLSDACSRTRSMVRMEARSCS
jgi:hypothetical protein